MSVCMLPQSLEISIHAPREGSDRGGNRAFSIRRISIHAPREGSDATGNNSLGAFLGFLSTLPARGATLPFRAYARIWNISIHAPREGSDDHAFAGNQVQHDFYPRSPRGERQQMC